MSRSSRSRCTLRTTSRSATRLKQLHIIAYQFFLPWGESVYTGAFSFSLPFRDSAWTIALPFRLCATNRLLRVRARSPTRSATRLKQSHCRPFFDAASRDIVYTVAIPFSFPFGDSACIGCLAFFRAANRLMPVRFRFRAPSRYAIQSTRLRYRTFSRAANQIMRGRFRFRFPSRSATWLTQLRCRAFFRAANRLV